MDDLKEYKKSLFEDASIDSEANEIFPEESFFDYVSNLLSETGILDNVEYCPYRNTNKGIKIDGYSWNPLEKTISGIVVNYTNEPDVINTLTNTEITNIGNRVTRFFENIQDPNFTQTLEVTDPGRMAAEEIIKYYPEAIKFRIVLVTDEVLSVRVKKVQIEKILDKETTIEIWDLERIKSLDQSSSDHEEFTVDLMALGGSIKALPANTLENGVSTYLAIMPGNLLSAIYNEFGQRLLESNVRTFLDFRAGTNKGMRKTLLTEPDNFFAYNNGLTVTATAIKKEIINGELVITELENMQIVNGGQTTAAIYFSPREKGGIKGEDKEYFFRDIDLDKVYVQMKLTVVGEKDTAEVMKEMIAKYANSQNSIQESDLESNHPFHLNIETRSRKQTMPAGEDGISTKWFYERARGQYSTLLRAMSGSQKRKFETEYPKKQLFTKVDMAKYENTWRMLPHIVKKGAQANLKALGVVILKEYEKNEEQFGGAFYQSLVAKMILFRQSDTAIMQSNWYQADKGFKAETVTYSLSLLRHLLIQEGKDINLSRIYQNQSISKTLSDFIVNLAKKIRGSILDLEFRGGVANPSEFCKSEKGWFKFQQMNIDLSSLNELDLINGEQIQDRDEESKELNKVSKSISQLEEVMKTSPQEWDMIAKFNTERFGPDHISVGIPKACILLIKTGKYLSEKQSKLAIEIKNKAYEEGFEFIS